MRPRSCDLPVCACQVRAEDHLYLSGASPLRVFNRSTTLIARHKFVGVPALHKRQVSVLHTKSGNVLQPNKGDLAVYAARELRRYIVSAVFAIDTGMEADVPPCC